VDILVFVTLMIALALVCVLVGYMMASGTPAPAAIRVLVRRAGAVLLSVVRRDPRHGDRQVDSFVASAEAPGLHSTAANRDESLRIVEASRAKRRG
jgi:hypothetical protein